jgi:hypothetical protein
MRPFDVDSSEYPFEGPGRFSKPLCGGSEKLDVLQPARQWVPSGTNLGHQPPLASIS